MAGDRGRLLPKVVKIGTDSLIYKTAFVLDRVNRRPKQAECQAAIALHKTVTGLSGRDQKSIADDNLARSLVITVAITTSVSLRTASW